jgi:hypothetical protein
MRVKAVVALHAALAIRVCPYTRTEFLKVYADPVEANAASAVWTFNFFQFFKPTSEIIQAHATTASVPASDDRVGRRSLQRIV